MEQLNNHEQIVVIGEKLDSLLAIEFTLLPSMMTLITEISDSQVIASILTVPQITNLPVISRVQITYCIKDSSGQVIETKFIDAPNTIKIIE